MNQKEPLAFRMRPRTLDEVIGQSHILGRGRLLRRAIKADRLSSLVFYGPPGTGKTTIARIIASTTSSEFQSINAVLAGKKDIRDAIDAAEKIKKDSGRKYILFVDEVHRFNKAQQDALLPHVENGLLTLIGATAENPYFEVNKALLSRSRVFQFRSLSESELKDIAWTALSDEERGYGSLNAEIVPEALEHIVKTSNGDARAVLNALELAVETTEKKDGKILITVSDAEESIQRKAVLYDRDGDAHYDTISAFIKSIRGSDPDAALFWMAKMIYAGEDPRFIFRRMLISAAEDVGLADPHALGIVADAARAFDYVGLPEGRYHLTQACLYLSTAPKSNSAMAFFDALNEVERGARADVPNHLKDSSRDKEEQGHGKGYLYPHAYRDHWIAQKYLPDTLKGKYFYKPSDMGYEASVKRMVTRHRELQFASLMEPADGFEDSTERPVKEYWLRRSLQYTGKLLYQVGQEVFRMMDGSVSDMVLDLSGGKGFLTWEACSRFQQGGVWSRCQTQEEYRMMKDWVANFDYFLRPRLILMPWNNVQEITEDGKPIKFDSIVGYRIFSHENQPQVNDAVKLLQTLKTADNGRMVFVEINYPGSQRFSDVLTMLSQGDNQAVFSDALKDKIVGIEIDFYESYRKGEDTLHKNLEESTGLKIEIYRKEFTSKRYLSMDQINSWFECTADNFIHSALPRIKDGLSSNDWEKIINQVKQLAGRRELNWKQAYTFYLLKK